MKTEAAHGAGGPVMVMELTAGGRVTEAEIKSATLILHCVSVLAVERIEDEATAEGDASGSAKRAAATHAHTTWRTTRTTTRAPRRTARLEHAAVSVIHILKLGSCGHVCSGRSLEVADNVISLGRCVEVLSCVVWLGLSDSGLPGHIPLGVEGNCVVDSGVEAVRWHTIGLHVDHNSSFAHLISINIACNAKLACECARVVVVVVIFARGIWAADCISCARHHFSLIVIRKVECGGISASVVELGDEVLTAGQVCGWQGRLGGSQDESESKALLVHGRG